MGRATWCDMPVKVLHPAWAALQRGPIALDRITERTLCVIDDDQIAGSRTGLRPSPRREYRARHEGIAIERPA
jgi:hypothetical protein